jgi:methionyl-tRNA synthetase
MSKSIGNVVDPIPLMEKFGVDSVRYFLLKEGGMLNDGDFSVQKLKSRSKGKGEKEKKKQNLKPRTSKNNR